MKIAENGAVRMLVLSVVLGGAAVAAQDPVQAPSDADESGIVGYLRSINTAEVAYASTYHTGFSSTLKALSVPDEGTNYTSSAAGLIDASLRSGKRNGYIFTYKPGPADPRGKITTYATRARPMKWRKGVRNFFGDQTGVIHYTAENRPAGAKDPDIGN